MTSPRTANLSSWSWPTRTGVAWSVDEDMVLTGFRPDLSFLSEVRLGLGERLHAPTAPRRRPSSGALLQQFLERLLVARQFLASLWAENQGGEQLAHPIRLEVQVDRQA